MSEPWLPLPPDEGMAKQADCACGHQALDHYGGNCVTGCPCPGYRPDTETIEGEDDHER